MRKTTQFLAPLEVTATEAGNYDIYPVFPLQEGSIKLGLEPLAAELATYKSISIDGYVGLFWRELAEQVQDAFAQQGKQVAIYLTEDYMKPSAEVDAMVAPFLNGDDLVFGRITTLELKDWFKPEFFSLAQNCTQEDVIHIILGCGASLAGTTDKLLYIDLPKNEQQFRMRAGAITNLGTSTVLDNKQGYKRLFFVDWVVLNRHKCALLPSIDYMIDGQHTDTPTYTTGAALRVGLEQMAQNFLRVRPWFEPGAWGGQWMGQHITQLNKDVPNYAWSFELMSLENGLMFGSDGLVLEVTFDTLMFAQYEKVLGKSAARFQYDFPIRFDFLDTFDGGNLSVQCHPRPDYMKAEFGMPFTQDETYYILDCQKDPQVYLGFQEGVEPAAFEQALTQSQEQAQALDIEQFVQKHPAKKHDLFLIPNGTIHGSGKDNMVLEISSAPYIFTFKMYDWMRLDLDGKPRPINIERGMANLYFDRQGSKVQEELICKPLAEQRDGYLFEELSTHPEHFYEIHRYTFDKELTIQTGGHANVLMMVEGQSVMLITEQGMKQRFNYAETFIIPAAAGSYKMINEGNTPVMLVESRVKDDAKHLQA